MHTTQRALGVACITAALVVMTAVRNKEAHIHWHMFTGYWCPSHEVYQRIHNEYGGSNPCSVVVVLQVVSVLERPFFECFS